VKKKYIENGLQKVSPGAVMAQVVDAHFLEVGVGLGRVPVRYTILAIVLLVAQNMVKNLTFTVAVLVIGGQKYFV
jgi:hypothetical protein